MRAIPLLFIFACSISFIEGVASIPLLAQETDSLSAGSGHRTEFLLKRGSADSVFRINRRFILPGSERLYLDTVLLVAPGQYYLDAQNGEIHIHRNNIALLSDTVSSHHLVITFTSFPFDFRQRYLHREPVVRIDTIAGRQHRIVTAPSVFALDDLFGSNLRKSGTIIRGLSVGSNRDLSLNSGFRLQMSGNISKDLEIIAALTDQNSPIQPEGNTQTLREIDQVFVELRSPDLRATLGDFTIRMNGGEFGTFQRKLQGAQGTANYRAGKEVSGSFTASGAVARGKFATNEFTGIERLQGPYLLTGENNNRTIIAVAGTEHVYVNGVQMVRGENNDYTIDYGTAGITFTPHRMITSGARIVVDFEYNDRHYNRSFVAAGSETDFLGNRLKFGALVMRETDNENSPVDLALSDSDRAVLRNAGNDQTKAVRSGVEYVGPGKGSYAAVDTVVLLPSGRDSSIRIFRYDPADTATAVYSVTFSPVGSGKGDYNRVSAGQYQFNGIGMGNYSPVRLLPLPQSHTLVDITFAGGVSDQFKVTGEYAVTALNTNLFSEDESVKSNGNALGFTAAYENRPEGGAKSSPGSFGLNVKNRFVGRTFLPADRFNSVEFRRDWNILDSSAADEQLIEAGAHYSPFSSLGLAGSAGFMRRGDPFSSRRMTFSGSLTGENLPVGEYGIEWIGNRNSTIDQDGNWIRQHATVHAAGGEISPRIALANELLISRTRSSGALRNESYRMNEIMPGLAIGTGGKVSLNADIGVRWDDSASTGSVRPVFTSVTQHYTGDLRDWHDIASSIDLTLRKRTLREEGIPVRSDADDHTSMLLRWQTHINPFNRGIESDWLYEVATERTAKPERIFQRVAAGTGNYIYAGDVNGNHIVDLPDFQLSRFDGDYVVLTVPSDVLTPVVGVRIGTRFRLTPSSLLGKGSWWSTMLSALTSESSYRIEENSTESDASKIYLLHFSRFMRDETTLSGNNLLTQDLYVFENNPAFSLRMRYSQRQGLAQYAVSGERTYYREQSARIRWQLIPEIANETDWITTRDALASGSGGTRPRDVSSTTLQMDWSYRPEPSIELGFRFSVGRGTNSDTLTADLNDQQVRCTYAISGRGQVKGEISREEVTFNRLAIFVPFELTGGHLAGRTWLWQLGFDYQVSRLLQATLSYEGRKEKDREAVHSGRAEVRAFF